ncbi:MAG: tetratricopeptide repeat protein [Pyrinomonadaceae bacterium]|nr:tetratricopeptide repeat protein [Pyrinomonadaceae bacterium]
MGMIGQTFSHYRILESLGEGAMGSVYVAEDTHLGRRVAIKFPVVTRDEHHYRARFLREARAVSMLNHVNIAAIYDYGETDEGQPFIVMELVEGATLSDLLHEHGLTIERAVEIIEAVADALSEAHSKGIVHRDVKPTNVVINKRGVPKVLDFGLAKQTGEEHAHSATDPDARTLLATKTQSGAIVGTPLYLSPEQATGAPVDARSDIFALGGLLYECIAGRPAFDGDNVIKIVAQVIEHEVPPPSKFNPRIPPELDRIALKALEKKPDARYQSADEFLADLRAVRTELKGGNHSHTQAIVRPQMTGNQSALITLSEIIQRPRISIGAVLLGVLALSLVVWGVVYLLRPVAHQPTGECRRWYDTGTNALRDGAYYQASKALERAISCDKDYALAHARLAESWAELDYGDKAREELITVMKLVPDRSILQPLDKLYLQAVTDAVSRDFTSAIKNYSDIVAQVPDAEKPYAYVDLGRAYEKNDELDKAISSYIEATNRAPEYATAFLRLGTLYGRKREVPTAIATFGRAEAIYEALNNVEGRAEVLYRRAVLLNDTEGRVAEAREQLEKARVMAQAINSQYQQIRILLLLSSVAYKQSKTTEAQAFAREAVDLAQANQMEALVAKGLTDLGNVYFAKGDYAEAESYFKQALEYAQKYKGRLNEARARGMLASLYIQRGNVDEGLPYLEQALSFYQAGSYHTETSQLLILRGRTYRQKGNYDAALNSFQQQLQLAEQAGDKTQIAYAHTAIGKLFISMEQYEEALHHFDESYALNRLLGNQLSIGYDLLNRGEAMWWLGREGAVAMLNDARRMADRPDNSYKELLALIYLIDARMLLSEQRFAEAKAKCQDILNLAGTQYKSVAVGAKIMLGLAQSFSGQAGAGKQLCEGALSEANRIGDTQLISDAQLALAETSLAAGRAEDALSNAEQAELSFSRSGQKEPEWRAYLIAGEASRKLNDAEKAGRYFSRASELLSALQQKWGEDTFKAYLSRPDIQLYYKRLNTDSSK